MTFPRLSLFRFSNPGFLLMFCLLPWAGYAEKIWTNSASGLWRDGTNWSGHSAPDINAFIQLTNENTKTVLIDSLTDATNLTVQKLTLSAPPGQTNTLLLSNGDTNNPLVFQTGLEMLDGAMLRVTNSALYLLLTNDHVNIDGNMTIDSGLIDFGDTTVTSRVGRVTSGTLTINGGLVRSGVMTIGGLTNSTGTTLMNGGQLNVSVILSVGRNAGTTGTFTMQGGQLYVPNDDTRVGDGGVGFMTLSNCAAWMTNLIIGHDSGSSGSFLLQSGATLVMSNDIDVATSVLSTGVVAVAGGQIVASGQRIKVGRQGPGQMTVTGGSITVDSLWLAAEPTNTASGLLSMSGGLVNIATNLFVGAVSYSSAQASLGGGSLFVTNAARSGVFTVANGTFTMTGGTLTTDNLVLTNSTGQFVQSGGTLVTAGTSVANGAAFTVGNGNLPAVLRLNGGTHVFTGGLIISSNATLAGCGTIVGSIINHGTISTNCGAVLVAPLISRLTRSGTTATVSFSSVSGQSYGLDYKNNLNDPAWTSISGLTSGNGNVLSLSDTTASTPARFYRLRTQ